MQPGIADRDVIKQQSILLAIAVPNARDMPD